MFLKYHKMLVSFMELTTNSYFLLYSSLYFTNNFKMSIVILYLRKSNFKINILWYCILNEILANMIISNVFSLFSPN